MMVQQTMFEALEAPRNAHEIRFNQFHKANPEVWHLWCQFTLRQSAVACAALGQD